jgi:hypothetical protein
MALRWALECNGLVSSTDAVKLECGHPDTESTCTWTVGGGPWQCHPAELESEKAAEFYAPLTKR